MAAEKSRAPVKKAPAAKPAATPSKKPAATVAPPAATGAKVDWRPEYYKGRAYVPVEQVASYYDMPKPVVTGDGIVIQNKYFRIELEAGSRQLKLNGWTFYFSYSVTKRNGRTLVSVFDVRNVLDPIMRPNDRRDPAVLKTVVIDPAGGGREAGIKSPFIAEKDLTLDVAKQLAELCKAEGFKVVLTRDSDVYVSAEDRQKKAETVTDEAIFISLRASSGGSGKTRGFESSTLPPAGTPATSEDESAEMDKKLYAGNINDRESLALATVLQSSAVTNLKTLDLGIKRHRFGELRDINLPAAVCRLGYLSHRDEAEKLGTPEYRTLIARSLADGVQRYAKFLSDHIQERTAEEEQRPLKFGTIAATCTIEGAGLTGEQVVVEMPIVAKEAAVFHPGKIEVQLYLFEHVNDKEIDLSLSDPPKIEWVSVLPDWRTSKTEVLRATYLRPPFGATEAKTYGKRSYHGYVARLVYDGKVMDETSSPPNLHRALYYFTTVFPRR
jgi:N-acetylmuramoyl-L-alanine amidase